MTARHQIRVGGRRLGRERGAPIDATPAPPLGEMLRLARERKGVDIYRAERDTKIRAKHLDALESGAYSELPGAVYTKGFLRNYALYLGLDPEEVIGRWRSETSTTRRTEAVVVTPPRPIAEPRRGLTFSRGIIVAALVSVAILAFVAYVVLQVARFNQAPAITLDGPPVVELALDAETYVLSGVTTPGATVSVSGAADFLRTADAGADGRWSIEVPVVKGRNDFTITAKAPEAYQSSAPVSVIITVPVPATEPPPSAPPGSSAAPGSSPAPGSSAVAGPPAQLTLTSPAEGASTADGQVVVSGTTDGSLVSVVVEPLESGPGASPDASATPLPSAGGAPPSTVDVTPDADGTFTHTLALAEGSWRVIVSASGVNLSTSETSRTVTVEIAGITVVVSAERGNAWLEVQVDGRPAEGWYPGHILVRGDSATFIADRTVFVRTGNSGATSFTVNGESIGSLGDPGAVENWVFEKGRPPRSSP